MAEAARAGATAPHRGLPDEIAVWEILVRLPPKSLLRCRAVCRAWRGATSARGFLLAHHARQPTLPLVYVRNRVGRGYYSSSDYLDIIPFDHRDSADQLQSVARLGQDSDLHSLEASCDGLVVLSFRGTHFSIFNPATRQYAPLCLPSGFSFVGMYRHPPTGEYRILMYPCWIRVVPGSEYDCYVLSLGSGQPPRNIGLGEAHTLVFDPKSVLFRGRLHWYRMEHDGETDMIIVFDITAESFRQMRVPVVGGCACDNLFEMDGMLGMSSFNNTLAIIDIWVLQDYEGEVWTIKCHIELPFTEIRAWCGMHDESWDFVVVPGDGELLVLVKFAEWLLQADMDGKLVARFHRKGIHPTQFQLKQTLVQHDFFPTLEGYVVNDFPFI
ncbi:hypothetical protein ACQJBY_029760 [Aegilops geniculata]